MHTLPLNDESAGECHTDDVTASHPDSRHVDGDGWDPLLISFGGHLVQEVVVRPGVLKHKQNSSEFISLEQTSADVYRTVCISSHQKDYRLQFDGDAIEKFYWTIIL